VTKSHLDVLVVDDDPLVQMLLRDGMNPDRFSVTAVGAVKEALALCGAVAFDVAILDYHLSTESGLGVAALLRDQKVPFIVLTASADGTLVREATRQGSVGYLVKPATPRQVESALEAALGK
jgi:CheY-like chemotaxis protein